MSPREAPRSLLLVVLVVVAAASLGGPGGVEGLSRHRRQYSGYSDVGYRHDATWRHRAAALESAKPCIEIHEIAHGQAACGHSGCRLRCLPGYEFVTTANERSNTAMLSCDSTNGTLHYRGELWRPEMTMCAPVCTATCLNGGTCVAPDKCACAGPYTGDTCDEEPMLGDQPYKDYQPATLDSNQRRVECEPGTRMPDGSTSVTLTFRDNSWFYPDGRLLLGVDQVTCDKAPVTAEPTAYPEEEKPLPGHKPHDSNPRPDPLTAPEPHYVGLPPKEGFVSPVTARCSPPCANGGECVFENTCSCPRGYWGPTCHARTCSYPRFQSNLHASLGGTLKRLKFECHLGYRTRDGRDRVVVMCQDGAWKLPNGRMLMEDDVRCHSE